MNLLLSTSFVVAALIIQYGASPAVAAAMEYSEPLRSVASCPPRNPTQDKYDFATLLAGDVWAIHGQPCNEVLDPLDTSCSFYFTFCQKLPSYLGLHANCSQASVCMVNDDTDETRNLGTESSFYYENRAGLNRGGKFDITYTVAGSRILTSLAFTCNRSVSWYNPPSFGNESKPVGLIGRVHSGYDDMVAILFDYDGACLNVTATVPPPTSDALTGGAIFAIVLFVLIGVYVFGGTLVNMMLRNKSGVEAFPNYNTWTSAFTFVSSKVRGGSASEKRPLVSESKGSAGEGDSLLSPGIGAASAGGKGSAYEEL